VPNEWDGQFAIAALESPVVEVSYQTTFEAEGDGKSIWKPFAKDGRLANSDEAWVSSGEKLAGAIAVRFTLKPGEKRVIPMVISWDLPIVAFGSGRQWYRRYTDFYGSMPLAKFWPDIDKQVLRQFADTVPHELPEKGLWVWKSQQAGDLTLRVRKRKGAVPHDLGVPEEDPFFDVNQFAWQDTNGWKDLNSKFVLMIYRDFVLTQRKDLAFLRYTWPAVKEAMRYLQQYDHGGGLPENEGYPDQTYDTWV